MNGSQEQFSAYRMFCCALLAMLGVVTILAGAYPASPMRGEHFASNHAHMTGMNDHAVPASKNVQDHKTHATCSPGVGCCVFTVPAEEAFTLSSLSVTIERDAIAQLAARTAAPPLPPPKIMILV